MSNFTESIAFVTAVSRYRAMYATDTPAVAYELLENQFNELVTRISMEFNVSIAEVMRAVVDKAFTPMDKTEAIVERDEAKVIRRVQEAKTFKGRFPRLARILMMR